MEPARPPSARLAAVAAYGATVAVCAAVLCWGLNLHRRDLGVPLTYQGDSLQSIQYLKGTLENGWVLHNAQLGAPGALDMHDFPLTDSALFAIVRVLGWFTDDVFRVYNLFFLLGFPLAAVAAVAVMRHFGLSYPACVAGGVLYAFLPYHLIR
ncbi:MAG TPA: hypothetical protein VIL46_09195, partial [Gemmataceae bacterium]